MSETPEGYGAQSTPDMGESYPPQTGDLLGSYIARLSARVRELEAASTEPSAYQRSLEARIERLEAMMSDPEHEPICRDCGQPEHMDGCDVQPEPTAEPVCATCGHGKGYHQHVMSPGTWCDSGTLGKPCKCTAFKPVATEG